MDTFLKTGEKEEKTAEQAAREGPSAENEWLSGSDEPTRILFVCTGNTCRSPMAAALLNELGRGLNLRAESAGLMNDTNGSQVYSGTNNVVYMCIFDKGNG